VGIKKRALVKLLMVKETRARGVRVFVVARFLPSSGAIECGRTKSWRLTREALAEH
jgi:hypothetical protein